MRPVLLSVALILCLPAALVAAPDEPAAADIPSELTDYVNAADSSFSWKLADKTQNRDGTIYTIDLVSQTWHTHKWEHKLQVFVPKGVKPQATMVLYNDGGKPSATSDIIGMRLAGMIKSPFAMLFGVPKQPLYDGKSEDALIAESFVKYLVTNDPTWPLLFPMVKSVVRGMDALQAFAKQEWKFELKDFVITGASKRGWTAWLTAATGDKRVKAIAPMVFDTLSIPVQMDNQVKAFGKHSEMIHDYAKRDLLPIPKTEAARRLWTIIDPWTYRDRVTMPKMIVCGTNDPYWPLDALNTYWDGLKGDKWILYVPNAGHGLTKPGELLPTQPLTTLAAFCRSQVFDTPMPGMKWVCDEKEGVCRLEVTSAAKTVSMRVWKAEAETRDFRKARWTGDREAKFPATVTAPDKGFRAFFAETEYEMDDLKFTLSTQIRILEAKK